MSVYFLIHAITAALIVVDFIWKQENLCTEFDLSEVLSSSFLNYLVLPERILRSFESAIVYRRQTAISFAILL